MDRQTEEFGLTNRAKAIMIGVLMVFGIPILYASYLQFQGHKPLMGGLMIGLFLLFVLVLLIATGYKIELTDSSLRRQGFFTLNAVDFDEIEAIHFGSSWSNFHIEADGHKIFITNDFENYEQIIHKIIARLKTMGNFDDVSLSGDASKVDQFT